MGSAKSPRFTYFPNRSCWFWGIPWYTGLYGIATQYSALGLEHTLVFFPFFARDRALKNVSLRLPTSARRARSIYDEKIFSSLLTSTTIL